MSETGSVIYEGSISVMESDEATVSMFGEALHSQKTLRIKTEEFSGHVLVTGSETKHDGGELSYTFYIRQTFVEFEYHCNFLFRNTHIKVIAGAVDEFKHGFWITAEQQWTKGSDCKYWVPPSAIYYIEKVEV